MLKLQRWKKGNKRRNVFVDRDDKGKLISWHYQKGTKLSLTRARQIYSEYKTLKKVKGERIKKQKEVLTNFRTITRTIPTKAGKDGNLKRKNIAFSKPRGTFHQYVIEGKLNGQTIYVRSHKVGTREAKTSREAKEWAWETFLERISDESGAGYDADEGIKYLDDVTDLREGWVSYESLAKN